MLAENFLSWWCLIPDDLPEQLYDLVVVDNQKRYVSPNAVCVVPEFRETCTFLHIADLHLLAKGSDGTLEYRHLRRRALVARTNVIRPDFVLCTGDLVDRYGAKGQPLSPQIIRWQARRIQEIMLELEVPIFITTGNHDVAFQSSRAAWKTYVGWPWNRMTDDYSFEYGRYHFAALDCFAHYDVGGKCVGTSFTPQQRVWLKENMRSAISALRRFLFIHYDYQKQLPVLFDGLGIDMLFYGHSSKNYAGELEHHGILDGHLASNDAYRLVHVTPVDISSHTVSWAEVMREESGEEAK